MVEARARTRQASRARRARFVLATICALGPTSPVEAQSEIAWTTVARAYRGRSAPQTLVCPAGGSARSVWGTDTYTDDSSICTAAVHAGVIDFEEGGTIVLEMRPGRSSYRGSTRNGVASQPWDEWEASFIVSRHVEPEPDPPKPPPPPPVIGWIRTAAGLAPNGRRFTFRCRARSGAPPLHGTDTYSWDSSICAAAAHAGAIPASGGLVTIEMRPGLDKYEGAERNGVASTEAPGTMLGFVVIRSR